MSNIQYWLAELDQYGNPTLIDGAHSSRASCNKAAYLIQNLNCTSQKDRKFAVARVELSECVPSAKGVKQWAVDEINRAVKP